MQVPSSALMFRDSGMAVATVEAGDRVAIKRVAIAHDFGSTVEIAYGLGPQDRVINNPPDSLHSGDHVQVANAEPARGAPKLASRSRRSRRTLGARRLTSSNKH